MHINDWIDLVRRVGSHIPDANLAVMLMNILPQDYKNKIVENFRSINKVGKFDAKGKTKPQPRGSAGAFVRRFSKKAEPESNS